MRKYDKGEQVNVNQRGFQGVGTIEDWKYYPEHGTHDYFVRDLTGQVHGWWEEGHLEQLKIHLPREDDKKMEVFYEMLNTTGIGVSYEHNPKKETYTLVGIDLHIAKAFFQAAVRSDWANQVVVGENLYLFHPNGTLREEIIP